MYSDLHNYNLICNYLFTCRGVWNVPYMTAAMLISGEWLRGFNGSFPVYQSEDLDPDMTFCRWMRDNVCVYLFPIINNITLTIVRDTSCMLIIFIIMAICLTLTTMKLLIYTMTCTACLITEW